MPRYFYGKVVNEILGYSILPRHYSCILVFYIMSIFAHLQKMQIIDKIMCKIVKTNQSYNNISMRSRLSQKNSHSESNHRQSGSDQFLLLIANKKN